MLLHRVDLLNSSQEKELITPDLNVWFFCKPAFHLQEHLTRRTGVRRLSASNISTLGEFKSYCKICPTCPRLTAYLHKFGYEYLVSAMELSQWMHGTATTPDGPVQGFVFTVEGDSVLILADGLSLEFWISKDDFIPD